MGVEVAGGGVDVVGVVAGTVAEAEAEAGAVCGGSGGRTRLVPADAAPVSPAEMARTPVRVMSSRRMIMIFNE